MKLPLQLKKNGMLFIIGIALIVSGARLLNKKKSDTLCIKAQSGDLGVKHCFDALSFYKDFNVVRAVHPSSQDLHHVQYAEFKNTIQNDEKIALTKIKPIQRNCSLEKLSDNEFLIQPKNENACFAVELPEDAFTYKKNKIPFMALDIVMHKTENDFKLTLYTEENNTVAVEEASGWNSFDHEFTSLPNKGDIVFVEDEYRFTVGEDQDQGLEFNRSRSIHHGVGSWPGGLGRRITLLKKHSDKQYSQSFKSEGLVLESKRYQTDDHTVLRIYFRKGKQVVNIKWGLLIQSLTSPVQIKNIELFTPSRLTINKRFVFLNPEAYSRFVQNPDAQDLLSVLQKLEPGFL